MAGESTMAERETEKATMAEWQWQWRAQYFRYFPYPSSYLNSINCNDNSLCTIVSKRGFKSIWLTSVGFLTVSLQPSDISPQLSVLSVLSVSYQDVILEEHHVSKLHFVWPQVSCLSGYPSRGSLVVIASYINSQGEKQKFALRFSTPSETEDFITSMEDILSGKFPTEISAVIDFPTSSQSECIPPYRPDTTSMIMSPIYASSETTSFHYENHLETQFQTQDIVADTESNGVVFPPRFTSLVSSCSTEPEGPEQSELALALVPELQEPGLKSEVAKYMQDASFLGELALTLAPELQEPDLKSQIAKYMQDASFLDIVSKVNEVITELGGDFAL